MRSLASVGLLALILAACGPEGPAPASSQAGAQSDCMGKVSPQSGALEPLTVVGSRGTTDFQVEIADSPEEQEFGLMCRRTLAADRGMLFEFDQPQALSFWMKDTLIPLDIVFIGADGRVINIADHARPMDETPLNAVAPAVAVLEIAAGRAAQIGLAPGAQVNHRFFTR